LGHREFTFLWKLDGLSVRLDLKENLGIDFYLCGQKYRYFIVRFFNGSGYFIYIFYSTVVN
jgi:hypothetical protein